VIIAFRINKFFETDFTIKVNVKKRRFDRSTVILKLKSEKCLNALKYKQTIIKMHICYLPGGRSVWEKTVLQVLSTARSCRPRAVLKTKGTVFFPYGPT